MSTSGEFGFECRDKSKPKTTFGFSGFSRSSSQGTELIFQHPSVCAVSMETSVKKSKAIDIEKNQVEYCDKTKSLTFCGVFGLSVFWCITQNERVVTKVFSCVQSSSDWDFLRILQRLSIADSFDFEDGDNSMIFDFRTWTLWRQIYQNPFSEQLLLFKIRAFVWDFVLRFRAIR